MKANTLPLFLILLCLPVVIAARATVTSPVFAQGGEQQKGGPLKTFLSTVKDARQHLAAAAIARGTCTAIMYPVDVIKTRYQVSHPNPMQLEGVFDGLGGSILGQIPYGVLTFGSYEVYKRNIQERFPGWTPALQYAVAAILGDVTGSLWLCPSEVTKSQIQAGIYKTTTQAYSSILKNKGFGGLYQGFLGLAARDVPFRVIQLTSYEIVKSIYLKSKAAKKKQSASEEVVLSPVESALCGAISGTASAAITTPLDRIKTLMAVGTHANGASSSVFACASMILNEEGPLGLLTGLIPRVVYVAPAVTIFFIVYEATQQRLQTCGSFEKKKQSEQKSKSH